MKMTFAQSAAIGKALTTGLLVFLALPRGLALAQNSAGSSAHHNRDVAATSKRTL
jgi:hypothetical protein